MSVFCNWLLSEASARPAPFAITLHGGKPNASDKLINEIAQYLNEYDDRADGLWLAATDELISKAANDPSHRALIGLNDLRSGDPYDSSESFIQSLGALAGKGHMIFRWPEPAWRPSSPGRIFHAGIGTPQAVGHRCHIIIDPSLIPPSSIAHIIGDVFLEWVMNQSSGKPRRTSDN